MTVFHVDRKSLSDSSLNSFSFDILTQDMQAHENDINSIVFNPTNCMELVSCSDDHLIKIWTITQPPSQDGEDQAMA